MLIVSTRKLIVLAEQSDFEKSRIKMFDTVTLTEKIELDHPISSKDIYKIEVVAITKDNTILAAHSKLNCLKVVYSNERLSKTLE